MIKNDVLVLQTGCAAMSCAKAGLLTPEAAAMTRLPYAPEYRKRNPNFSVQVS